MAIATDIAEVIGGALALHLLFGLPLFVGGLITGAVSITILSVQDRRGQRSFEFVVVSLLAIITVGFLAGLAFTDVSFTDATAGWCHVSRGGPRRSCWLRRCSARR